MLLDVSSALKNVGEVYDFSLEVEIPPQNIYGETYEIDPVLITGIFTSTGNEILVSGTLETNVHGKCGTCLKSLSEEIYTTFSETFVKQYEFEVSEGLEDVELFYYDGVEIDLSEMLLQLLLPLLPMKFRCDNNCDTNQIILQEEDLASIEKENPFSVLQKLLKNDEEV